MKKLFILFALAALLFSYSCGSGGGGGGGASDGGSDLTNNMTSVTISVGEAITGTQEMASGTGPELAEAADDSDSQVITSALSDLPVEFCRIKITGPGMDDIVVIVEIAGRDVIVETIEVPVGISLYILIELIDNEDNVLFKADRHGVNPENETFTIEIIPEPSSDYLEPPEFAGIESISNIDNKSLRINWTPASDGLTSHDRIQYLIYISNTSINDSGDKELDFETFFSQSDATLLEDIDPLVEYSLDNDDFITLISYDFEARLMPESDIFAGHLVPGIPYYFIVRAKDEFGNIDNNFQEVEVTVYSLDVTVQGTGHVTSDPSGVDCGASCSEDFLSGTEVTLTESSEDADFNGWTSSVDECSGTGSCEFPIEENVSVTAEFCKFASYYKDKDGDGYGDRLDFTDACAAPAGYVDNEDDCDDSDAGINPGAAEVCDGVDNDCDGGTLDGSGETTPLNTLQDGVCSGSGQICSDGSWEDDYGAVGSYEADEATCDSLDNDCDGSVDEELTTTYYEDIDGDTYGNASVTQDACSQPSGYVLDNKDCNDSDAGIKPGAADVCDGVDNDCDGGTLDGSGETTPLNTKQAGVCIGSEQSCSGGSWIDDFSTVGSYEADEATCDSLDNDCDGSEDEELTTTYYEDIDGDTYGNASVTQDACGQPLGYVLDNTDCDDAQGAINPGAAEVCDGVDNDCDGGTLDGSGEATPLNTKQDGVCSGSAQSCSGGSWVDDFSALGSYEADEATCDGMDNDCDGSTDEGLTTTYYEDNDSDTYGNASITQDACGQPLGYVLDNTDCNDSDAGIKPGAAEVCDGVDNDCDGGTLDGSGETTPLNTKQAGVCIGSEQSCSSGSWVDDFSTVGSYETDEATCDGLDNDCDGSADEGLITTYYEDNDSDTYGNASVMQDACGQPLGYVLDNTDCNDSDAGIKPGAAEVCDGVDNDCDGGTLDGSGETTPLNTKQAGVCSGSEQSCSSGLWVDDFSAVGSYEADEATCDGLDNDCDGSADEGLTTTYYEDNDSDTYGNASVTQDACGQPFGYVLDNTDCDDAQGAINPGEAEVCDGVDNDCNGVTLDGSGEATPLNTKQAGVCSGSEQSCSSGLWVDDFSAVGSYEADEATCDGVDNDCDGSTDEGLTTTYYEDNDSDTYGNAAVMQDVCSQPLGYVLDNTDCDDTTGGINPGAAEVCDGVDNDCDGGTLDGSGEAAPLNTMQDGVCSGSEQSCSGGLWVDDYSAVGSYEADEATCDNLDNDCDGSTDEALTRATTCGEGQCAGNTGEETCTNGVWDNDTCDPLEGASGETCDGLDNNCDGQIDEPYADLGTSCSAGFGQCLRTGSFICNGEGNGTECSATPGIPSETLDACNGIDDNCDGQVDEGFIIMIGNNDGYGYGDASVPDGSLLPQVPVFDNRDASELAASDGAQYTDNTMYGPDLFFDMEFPVSEQWRIKTAKFILDVSGIQTALYGASTVTVDSIDYSSWLPQEQDVFGSALVEINISKVSVRDGYFGVSFEGGTLNGGDAIAIDYFSFSLECY